MAWPVTALSVVICSVWPVSVPLTALSVQATAICVGELAVAVSPLRPRSGAADRAVASAAALGADVVLRPWRAS